MRISDDGRSLEHVYTKVNTRKAYESSYSGKAASSKPAAISITEVDDGDSDSGSDIFEGGIKEIHKAILKRQSKKIREEFDDS
jgi:hypothetical protein